MICNLIETCKIFKRVNRLKEKIFPLDTEYRTAGVGVMVSESGNGNLGLQGTTINQSKVENLWNPIPEGCDDSVVG